MTWFDNVSSDSDQPVAAARLVEGHWRHQLHPYGDQVLCRLVIDLAEPRVVAAQVIEHGVAEDFTSSQLEDFSEMLIRTEVHLQARAWGFTPSQPPHHGGGVYRVCGAIFAYPPADTQPLTG